MPRAKAGMDETTAVSDNERGIGTMSEIVANEAAQAAMRKWLGRPARATVAASLALLVVYVANLALALTGSWPLWLAAIVSFLCVHPGFTILHEASHRAISGGASKFASLDPSLGTIHSALLLYDFPVFRFLHLRHHAHTNDPARDPDYWMQRKSVPVVLLLSLFIQLHYLRLYLVAAARGETSRRARLSAVLRIAALLALLTGCVVAAPLESFALWIAPAAVASSLVSLAHRIMHEAELSPDRRRTTRIIKADAFWSWLITPLFWLNHHHLLHHENPRLPLQSHRELFAATETELAAAGAKIINVGRSQL